MAEQAKPTPGPWEADGTLIVGVLPYRVNIAAINPRDEQWRANARLIAAAPDHHANAIELDQLSLVIESAVRNADPAFAPRIVALIKANRAALAKAEPRP